jgi:8-oxo-dGTP diphosphatase
MIYLAGCILLDEEDRIGLLHRNKKGVTQWELPGGKVETGESSEEAAVRELYEELGMIVTIERALGSMGFTSSDEEFHYTWFLGNVPQRVTPSIKEPETFDDFQHFAIEELDDLELSANMTNLYRCLKDGAVVL